MSEPVQQKRISRTLLLRRAGVVAVGVAGLSACGGTESRNGAALLGADTEATALGYAPPQRAPLFCQLTSFFTADEAIAVEAITARFVPGTPDDPGAREACVTGFIDSKLARYQSFATPTYFKGPFAKPVPKKSTGPQEHAAKTIFVAKSEADRYGFQSSLTPQETYRLGLAILDGLMRSEHGAPFVSLPETTQDDVLGLMEAFGPLSDDPKKAKAQLALQNSPAGKAMKKAFVKPTPYGFFSAVLEDTYEGMFADPIYGGNRDFAGWKLVGYPGAQRAYTPAELTQGPNRRTVQGLAQMPAMHPGVPAPDVILPVSGTNGKEH
jgi:gluconate 2-dehydrogenase gamma chain